MDITFSIPHAFSPDSPLDENSDVLRILLDCQVRLNQAYLRSHTVPALYQSRVRYGRTEKWYQIPDMLAMGRGDCKSLGPWLVAELLEKGIEAWPVFRFDWRQDGSRELDFHILVCIYDRATNSDTFDDPSARLGMGSNEIPPIPGL